MTIIPIISSDVMLKEKPSSRRWQAWLLFVGLLICLVGDVTFAHKVAAQAGSLTPANAAAGDGNAERGSLPAPIAETAEHGLPQKAVKIARPFGFPITNSMVVSWIVALGLILFARVATRDMKQVPGSAQNFIEWLVGGLYDFLESIIGPRLVKRTFWFFATVFIFILSANWVGLIPGVGTIGWGHQTPDGFMVDQPFFLPQGVICPQGREHWVLESVDDRCFLRRRLFGNHFDSLSTGITEFSSLRQHLCRGKHVGNHVPAGPWPRLALADSVLFHGIARGLGAGSGLHVVVRGVHSADLSA